MGWSAPRTPGRDPISFGLAPATIVSPTVSSRAYGSSSNSERGTPDWRTIDSSVPVRNSR